MEKLDYIVIGSGIAGLHTAYRLKQQGKKVLVLEKESYAGGRMSTRMVAGHPIDYGAKFVANFYKYMLPLAKELGVTLVPSNSRTYSIRRQGKLYAFDNASNRFNILFNKVVSLRAKLRLTLVIMWLIIKYRAVDFYKLESALYLDDKSIYEDLRPLAGEEGFDYIAEPFIQNVIFHKTKDLSRASFYSYLSKTLKTKTLSFPQGIRQLCQKLADNLPVKLNAPVKSVKRTLDGVMVTALLNGKEITYPAKNAIIAVPGNHVLDILRDPLPEEKSFFSQVRYASTVQIIARAKTDLFSEVTAIWTVPKENPNFSAFGVKSWRMPGIDATVFHASLKESAYKRLVETDNFDHKHIESLIQQESPSMKDVKIIDMQVWESATPIVYPGYITSVVKFLNRPNWDNGIYYCGDYLQNPSTEGALTSSVKLLEKITSAQ